MKTVKDILTENRDSVISSIKFVFKVWKAEDVKVKMVEFLAYAEANADVQALNGSKKVKTELKYLVQHMKISQKPEAKKFNLREAHGQYMETMGYISFNHMTKSYEKF